MKKFIATAVFALLAYSGVSQASTVLYSQNFENPNLAAFGGAYLGPDASWNSVNNIYNNQPAGFSFAQQYTVETLRVGGNQAWYGAGFVDPQAIAGNYVIGMLSSAQNDLLGLSFNVGSYQFLNFQLDISSIDLNFWGGTFVPNGGIAPQFQISLWDNPSGANGLGGGMLLDSAIISGALSPSRNTFNWTNHIVGLNAAGNTNGNVTIVIDELVGGYAALDNFKIVSSDVRGDVGQVPEPTLLSLMGLGIVALGVSRRKRRAKA